MSSLSSLSQSGQEIALLAIEGHVTWTLDTIESSIAKDINDANPNFDLDTHVEVYVDRVLERNGAPYAGYPPPKKLDALPRIFCRHLRASVGMSGHL